MSGTLDVTVDQFGAWLKWAWPLTERGGAIMTGFGE